MDNYAIYQRVDKIVEVCFFQCVYVYIDIFAYRVKDTNGPLKITTCYVVLLVMPTNLRLIRKT